MITKKYLLEKIKELERNNNKYIRGLEEDIISISSDVFDLKNPNGLITDSYNEIKYRYTYDRKIQSVILCRSSSVQDIFIHKQKENIILYMVLENDIIRYLILDKENKTDFDIDKSMLKEDLNWIKIYGKM